MKVKVIYPLLLIALISVFIFGLSFGFIRYSISDVFNVLLNKGDHSASFVILTLRMPRLLMTLIMGMALSVSGSVLQTLTKNDLADPGIIGINAGAGIGVTVAYLLFSFTTESFPYMMPIFGFIGAILTFSLTLYLSYDAYGGFQMNKLILLGVGSAISLSGIMILFMSSAGREDVQFIQSWLSGNIWGDSWPFLTFVLPISILLILFIVIKIPILNIMTLDDLTAQSLGVNLKKERSYLIVCSVALAAIVVSVAGAISFVGLITPHMAKKIFGPQHEKFIPASMLLGGLLLMSADLIGRNIFMPQGLLAGIVVSIIGAPYFLYLVTKTQAS